MSLSRSRKLWYGGYRSVVVGSIVALGVSCADTAINDRPRATADVTHVVEDVEAAVRAFHRADTARDAEAIVGLLWPEFTMLVDGRRQDYREITAGSREFLGSLEIFHTEWTDLQVVPLGPDVAVSSFQFRDSIVTRAGQLIQSRGPTTMVWERRSGEWRLRFADADHYPVDTSSNESE